MSKKITRAANVRAFENAGVTQEALATGDFDYYTVEGKPGTWKRLDSLGESIEYAKSILVGCVWGVRHLEQGVFKSAVWVDGAA